MGILSNVLDVYEKCDVYLFPINCLDIIRKLNIKAVPYSSLSTKKRNALKEVSKDSYRVGDIIYYNDDRRMLVEGRIRFNLMHELGHIVLGHMKESEYNELCADWFAGEILAPTIIVHECFKLFEHSAIKKAFNVSHDAADTKIKICKASLNRVNNFIPPGTAYNFPYDDESMKIYRRFYNREVGKLVYSVDICVTCWKDLYNGEECDCKFKRLKYGSRSMFDGEYIFG